MWRRITTAGAVAVCLGLAACGSSNSSTTTTALTPAQYTAFLQRLSQRENQAHQALDQHLHSQSAAEIEAALKAFADDQAGAATQVADVTPPANAKAANDALEKAFKDIGASIQAVVAQVANASSGQAAIKQIQAAKGPQQAGQELDAALAELKKLGYTQGS